MRNPSRKGNDSIYRKIQQPTRLDLSNGTYATYSYDTNSRITSLANRKSNNAAIQTYAYLYDASGNRTKITFSDGDYINYLYDGTSQLTKETRKNSSNVIEYNYSYVYDTIGNRTSIDDTNFSDNFNRADSSNLGSDWSEVTGNWEILSNRLSIPDASDNAICIWTGGDFTNPSIEAIMNAETAGTPRRSGIIVSYQSTSDFYYAGAYPQSNKWVIGRYQNGVWTDSTTLTETINKNQDYPLRVEVSGTNVTLYVKESGSWTQKLTYNFGTLPAGDVGVTVEQSHTKYDNFKVGKGFDVRYEYNSVNQLTKSVKGGTTRTYAYDGRGNLTKKIVGSDTTQYQYDHKNQLTKAITPSTTTTYDYSLGMRARRISGSNTTKYYYDGIKVLMEKNGAGTTTNTYTLAPHQDIGFIISERRNTTDYWYHPSELGTINNLTNSIEDVILTVKYDAFGNKQTSTGGGSTNYGLTTKELDPDTALYYFVARWYDSVEGRFITQDPVPDVNLYWYVRNNPVNYMDPSGFQPIVVNDLDYRDGEEKCFCVDKEFKEFDVPGSIPNQIKNIKEFRQDCSNSLANFNSKEVKKAAEQYLLNDVASYWRENRATYTERFNRRFAPLVDDPTYYIPTFVVLYQISDGDAFTVRKAEPVWVGYGVFRRLMYGDVAYVRYIYGHEMMHQLGVEEEPYRPDWDLN